MNKKKICFIASAPAGIVAFHKTNFEKLSEEFDIYVIANFKDKSVFKGLKITNAYSVDIARHPSVIGNIKALIAMYKIFKANRFDCFVSMSSNASLLASLAGRVACVPYRIRIFTGQVWANSYGLKRLIFKTVDRITVALNTSTLVDGKPQRIFLIENGILRYGQAEVLANGSICGVDIDKFCPQEHIRQKERTKLNISKEKVVFSFMGRINHDKGTYELLEAMNMLAADTKNALLVLIGNMENFTANVLSNYQNLRLDENVIIYGFTSEPYNALQISDVFCLPSHREGFGMSAIEAASLSLPVICSDIYGLKDSFVADATGLQCKVKNAKSLYTCMKRLYEDSDLRKKLGQAGRQRVLEKFTRDLVSTAWVEYLKRTIV